MSKSIFTLVLLACAIFTQAQTDVPTFKIGDWEWNSQALVDYGFTHWSSDLGTHSNFTTAAEAMIYNVSDDNAPIVMGARLQYMDFLGDDGIDRIDRSMIGVSVGVGIHVIDRLYGTINVGHLWITNEMPNETNLSSMYATAKLLGIATELPNNWSLIVNLEGGMTFQDIEFRDPPVNAFGSSPDKYQGTGFVRMAMGFNYKFN